MQNHRNKLDLIESIQAPQTMQLIKRAKYDGKKKHANYNHKITLNLHMSND